MKRIDDRFASLAATNSLSGQRVTFELNGKTFETDAATLNALRTTIPGAKAADDDSALNVVMEIGQASGRIRELLPFSRQDAKGIRFVRTVQFPRYSMKAGEIWSTGFDPAILPAV